MRQAYLILVLIFLPVFSGISIAQQEKPPGGHIGVCMIPLEHADMANKTPCKLQVIFTIPTRGVS
jgi:hypothetical protein